MKEEEHLFSLDALTGNWESVNLYPTVMIYRDGENCLLSFIHINETTGQASPATYEIQEDEGGYFIYCNLKRIAVDYNAKEDLLNLSLFGDYMRN
jgi:hypothetical protein